MLLMKQQALTTNTTTGGRKAPPFGGNMRYHIIHKISDTEAYEYWVHTGNIEAYIAKLIAKKGGTVEYR